MQENKFLRVFKDFEIASLSAPPPVFRSHFHEHLLIGHLIGGKHEVRLKNQVFELGSDRLLLLNKRQIHECREMETGGRWIALHILPGALSGELDKHSPIFSEAYIGGRGVLEEFDRLMREAPCMEESRFSELAEIFIQKLLCSMAGGKSSLAEVSGSSELPLANGDVRLSLEAMAAAENQRKYQFAHKFTRTWGISPYRHQLVARLNEGRRLLSVGKKPAEAALHAGFHDQAHFSRAFRAYSGFTPGEYLKAVKEGSGICKADRQGN